MKGIRNAIAVVIAATAIFGLTGCFGGSNDFEPYEPNFPPEQDRSTTVYYHPETGKITKMMNGDEEVIFEEAFSKNDTEIVIEQYNPYSENREGTYKQDGIISVDGAEYPISSTLRWTWASGDPTAMINFYNSELASAELSEESLPFVTPGYLVREHVNTLITQAATDQTIPVMQYQTTGKSVITTDTRIANEWQAGTPAWETLQKITGMPADSERYYYSFQCASYDVALANEAEVLKAAHSLPYASMMMFDVSVNTQTLVTTSAQPCEIKLEASTDQSKDPNKDIYDTPPPVMSNPPGDNPPPPPVHSDYPEDGSYPPAPEG